MSRMMIPVRLTIAMAVVLSIMAAPAVSLQDEEAKKAPAAGLKVGVVNLKECFNAEKVAWVKEVDDQLNGQIREFQKQLAAAKKKVQDIKDKIAALPKDSGMLPELYREERILEAQMKADKEIFQAQYLSLYTEKKTAIYNEIIRIAAIIGNDRGFDLILRAEEAQLDSEMLTERNLTSKIQQRLVLYHAPNLDITDDVIKGLNEEYDRRKAAAGDSTPAPWSCPACGDKAKALTEEEAKSRDYKCARCGGALEKK